MADVGKISPTKITTYMGCSMAYFLNYVVHEKVPTGIRMVFGKDMHYMLEQFYDKNFKSPEKFVNSFCYRFKADIAGDFLKGKDKERLIVREIPYTRKNHLTGEKEECVLRVGNHVDFGYDNNEDIKNMFFGYRNLGVGICNRFYTKHKLLKPPIKKEWSFGVRKDEPVEINGIPVRGVIDRIDNLEEDYYIGDKKIEKGDYITDYKTDKSSPERDSFTLHRNIQFTFYSYIFRKLFDKEEKAILYYHLRSDKRFETHRSEKDYDYLKRLLDFVLGGVTKETFVPFYGFHCNFCSFKSPCEKYSLPYHGGPRIDLEGRIKPAEEFNDWNAEVPSWIEDQVDER